MKTQTRRGVFETNSSSTHTIAICKDTTKIAIPETLHFEGGEFGWECDKHTDVHTRASYLYTAIAERNDAAELLDKLAKMLEDCGCKATFEPLKDGFCENGYIDHHADTTGLVYMLLSDKQLLLNYLFSDSRIYTYNDNMDFEDYKYAKEVDGLSEYEFVIYYKGN